MTPSFETTAREIANRIEGYAWDDDMKFVQKTIPLIEQALREAHAAGLDEGAEIAEAIGNESVSDHEAGGCYACTTTLRARAAEVREGK